MHKTNAVRSIMPGSVISLIEDAGTIFRYSAGILKKYRKGILLASVFKLMSFPLGLSLIYITKNTLDKGIIGKDLKVFLELTFTGLAVFLGVRGLQYLTETVTRRVKTAFSKDVNSDMTRRLFGLDYLKIRELSSAENTFLLDYDYHAVESLIFTDAPVLISLAKMPVLFVLAAFISMPLALMVFLSFPFAVAHMLWSARERKRHRARELYCTRRHYSAVHDALLNIRLIKSLFREDWASGRIRSLFNRKEDKALMSSLFVYKTWFVSNLFLKLNTVIFAVLGGYLIIKGNLSFGSFSAVSMYAMLIVSEVYNVSGVIQSLNAERPSIKRNAAFIKDITAEKETPAGAAVVDKACFENDIEFRELSFGYPGGRTLFSNLSFVIPSGKASLITGRSGEGKTTLLSLFLRLFQPLGGTILIGDKDISRIDRRTFSDNISVAHQEPHIFDGTLAYNILLGNGKKISEVGKALACSGMDELVEGLSLGYNTRVGEAGFSLSGGQKQRLAIARALARDPRILLLDEAMSFLDPAAEEDIFLSIRRSFPGITLIFITHRPSATRFADEIFLLSDGKVRKCDTAVNDKELSWEETIL